MECDPCCEPVERPNGRTAADLPDQAKLWEYVRSTKVVQDQVTSDVGSNQMPCSQATARKLSATYDFAVNLHGSIGPSCAIAEFKDGKLTSWSASQSTHTSAQATGPDVRDVRRRRPLHLCRRGWLLRPQRARGCGRRCRDPRQGGRQAGARAMVARRRTWLGADGPADSDGYARRRSMRTATSPAGKADFFMPQQTAGSFLVPLTRRGARRDAAEGRYRAGQRFPEFGDPLQIREHQDRLQAAGKYRVPAVLDRTPGRMQNTYANECFMDELAAEAKADPIAFRQEISRRQTRPRTDRAAGRTFEMADAAIARSAASRATC